MPHVAICTVEGDLHSLVVREILRTTFGARCDIVETDRLADHGGLSWSPTDDVRPRLRTSSGEALDIDSVDLVWWRRVNHPPQLPPDISDPVHVRLIENDTRAAFWGVLVGTFRGVWISEPHATRAAENKLLQLRAAAAVGFRVPRTLVSQDPDDIRAFCESLEHRVVVKAVRGTRVRPPLASLVNREVLERDDVLSLCPSIYQEYIEGSRHIRVHVFGDAVHCVLIESGAVDWRASLKGPLQTVELEPAVEERLRDVVATLGLRMGIIDLKLGPDGTPVWLEINPQGQFLFAEELSGLPLAEHFSSFLYDEACGRRATEPGHDPSAGVAA